MKADIDRYFGFYAVDGIFLELGYRVVEIWANQFGPIGPITSHEHQGEDLSFKVATWLSTA